VSRTRRLGVVLALNLGLVASLVVVGLAAHSLAVFAAGADYLADAAAIGVSLLAIWLASLPHGYANAAGAAGVAVSGAVILAADGWYWLDPATALVIAVIVGYHAAKLIRKIALALASPPKGSARSGSQPVGKRNER
jgi:Co/Zn/Cd efflux system component